MTTTKNNETDAIKKSIFLSITYDGTILEFNKECEKLTGYYRSEVLNKNIKDLLIPKQHLSEWNKLIAIEKQQKTNGTYDFYLQTKQKKEIEMTCTILSLNKKNDLEESFLLIGNQKDPQPTLFNNIILNEDNDIAVSENNLFASEQNQQDLPSKDRILLTKKQEKNNEITQNKTKPSHFTALNHQKKNKKRIRIKKLNPKKEKQEQQPQNIPCTKSDQPLPVIQPLSHTGILNLIQPDNINNSFQENTKTTQTLPNENIQDSSKTNFNEFFTELVQHYTNIQEKIHQLEQKEKQLEEKNHLLEQKLQEYTTASNQTIPKPHLQQAKDKIQKEKISKKKTISFLPNPFSMKKDKDEIQQKIKQLDEKEKQLHEFESQLLHDRKQYNTQIAQMTSWKEKLLSLESEIEKRRMDLLEHETMLTQQMKTPLIQQSIKEKTLEKESQPPFESIQQSAAIIQRGIIKQINNSFSKLLGFKDDEILEKSLFDFVSPEGLSEIEKYYLKRLKGNKESQYQTIFSTKSEDTIKATVRLQSTEYNGDTAEIAIIAIDNTDAEKSEQK